MSILRLRLQSLFRRSRADRDLSRELRFHLEARIRELIEEGAAPDEARRLAEREFGSRASIEEQCRDQRRVGLVENLLADLRYAARPIVREPMLALAATISIALGVGVNLTIFGLGNTLLLSTPTATRPDRLVHIRTGGGSHTSYRVWRGLDEAAVVDGIAGQVVEVEVNWRGTEHSLAISPLIVTANYFDVLGLPALVGRTFTASEARAEREPRLAVLGHRFWTRRLGADPSVVGGTITLNGELYDVRGVLPDDVRTPAGFGIAPDVYLPVTRALLPQIDSVDGGHLQLIGRLRDGQTVESAQAALTTAAARVSGDLGAERDARIRAVFPVGGIDQAEGFRIVAFFFAALLVVTMLVLTIACANVAGLLLARGTARRREIAIRLSLGATRGRLVQQMLTEGLVLSMLGVAAGLLLTAGVGSALSLVSLPLPLPIDFDVDFTGRLLWLAAGLVVASTVMSALAPALQATRGALTSGLKQETTAWLHRRLTARGLIVTGQVAISVVLLVVTLLFVRNLALAHTMAPGFDSERLVAAALTFVEGRQGPKEAPVVEAIVERLRSIPGVGAVSFADSVPLTPTGMSWVGTRMRIEGIPEPVRVDYSSNSVGPGYFAAMGIAVRRGREFAPADRAGAKVAIINEEFERRYFAGLDPIGRHMSLEVGRGQEVDAEVVAVVADSKYRSIGEGRQPAIYEAYAQRSRGWDRRVHVVASVTGAPGNAAAGIRSAILQFDGSIAAEVRPMTAALAFAFAPSRIGAAIMGSLGLLGAVLAMVGLYGVVAFNAARRTPEIAVRIALGATRGSVVRLVLADSAWLAAVGTIVGLGLAFAATPALSAFLVADLSVADPISFVAAALLLAATSVAAAWRPARRASRIDPSMALRAE
jgi:predicted permease